MIDLNGLTAEHRSVFLGGLLVENLRRRFNISDADMDELTAGALQILLLSDAGNRTARKLTRESTERLWKVVAGVDAARDGKTEH